MKKRDMATLIVAEWGRYVPDSPNLCYTARVSGKSFHSSDTAILADKIAFEFSAARLREIVKDIKPPVNQDEGE